MEGRLVKLQVNGEPVTVDAGDLAALLDELGYGAALVATAVNRDFVERAERGATALRDGDRIEIVAPMKGG